MRVVLVLMGLELELDMVSRTEFFIMIPLFPVESPYHASLSSST